MGAGGAAGQPAAAAGEILENAICPFSAELQRMRRFGHFDLHFNSGEFAPVARGAGDPRLPFAAFARFADFLHTTTGQTL